VSATTNINDSAAANFVQKFYQDYLSYVKSGTAPPEANPVVKKDATAKFQSFFVANQSHDPVLCSQNYPDSFKVTSHSVSGSSATVVVNENYSGGPGSVNTGAETIPATVTVLYENGAYKIDAIAC
jgi:hypothetical protein